MVKPKANSKISPIEWELTDPEGERVTFENLLKTFYYFNSNTKPIALRLITKSTTFLPEKLWVCVLRHNFHMIISEGTQVTGPHPLKLFYRSFSEKLLYWVATLQLEAFFFNEADVLNGILTGINTKSFFISDAEKKVEIIP